MYMHYPWPEVTRYRGVVSTQAGQKEIILLDLKGNDKFKFEMATFGIHFFLSELLAFIKSKECRFPDRIIFYR